MNTKILLLSPFILPFHCGNSMMAERLRSGLLRRGHEVALFGSENGTVGQAVSFAPRILHSLNADRPYSWIRQFLTRLPVPWVITLTGTDYNNWRGQKEPPVHVMEALGKADALVVFHEEARVALAPFVENVKIDVVPQGVAFSKGSRDCRSVRERYGIDPESVVFLMVSGIRRVKNIGHAIRAFRDLERRETGAVLVVAGPVIEGEESRQVLSMSEELVRFHYLGERSSDEVRDVMACADVFLNTSLNEGMPGAVLEAMVDGLLILASDTAGNRAVVEHGRNGFLFSLDQTSELVDFASRLSRDPELRVKMGKAGRKIVEGRHSVDRELECYEAIYQRVLQNREIR
jgi:glycosyltransferase involved in cell wall biosynthesis